jgi:hypothetical protein
MKGVMQVAVHLCNENGEPESCSLTIAVSETGRLRVCKMPPDGVNPCCADALAHDLLELSNLSFGKTCWLPSAGDPLLRFTGMGNAIEVRENRAGNEPVFALASELREAVLAFTERGASDLAS